VKRSLRKRILSLAAAVLVAAGARAAGAQPPPDPSDLINTLLGSLLGFREMTGPELQQEVAEVGGVPFKSPVPLDYITHDDLGRYLKEVLDSEYPLERAQADQRTLVAFTLLAPGVDLRPLRSRLLEENVAGFYDERPGKKRLYAVSADRRLTPANQLILAHELRHALQDQYVSVHDTLPDSVGDFDDRRLAFLSLLEGDATLVMERFLRSRLPNASEDADLNLGSLSVPAGALPGTPAVLQDQLVLPYLVGRDFVRALWKQGSWGAVQAAWTKPPASTEQVLHPEKYLTPEPPRAVEVGCEVPGGRTLNEGVLGEMLIRTLLGEGEEAAAAGWGGDRFRVWDVSGKTVLVWRSVWDAPAEAREFLEHAKKRFASRATARGERSSLAAFEKGAWRFAWGEDGPGVLFVSSDDGALFDAALRSCRARR
jgi:hypothetical protein